MSSKTFANLKFLQRPAKYRPAGSPAGTWPHTPWWVCTFYDPYERVNVWSHGIPGLTFLLLGLMARANLVPGGAPLFVFGVCSAICQICSAITHIYPDDVLLEKLDHLGIPFLIIGTPLSALMATTRDADCTVLAWVFAGLLGAAFFPPLQRTLTFIALGALNLWHYRHVVNANVLVQVVLNVGGGVFFVLNGGHNRPVGLQDHHFLHYCVTLACCLHVHYIWAALKKTA